MKTRLIPLALLCALGLVQADGMPGGPMTAGTKAASAQAQTRHRAPGRKLRRLPTGDLRHCLELGGNEEIIRCAENPRRR